MNINYVNGDATNPISDGNIIIPHIVNTWNIWGAGFVLALTKRWPEPEAMYKNMSKKERSLNNVQFVAVENKIIVANMVAQEGVGKDKNGKPPIRYEALRECLIKVNNMAILQKATIHAPRFGNGLAGGNWNIIEKIIKDTITVDVTIYDFK